MNNHCRLGISSKNETYKSRRFPFLLATFMFYSQFEWFTANDPTELGLWCFQDVPWHRLPQIR